MRADHSRGVVSLLLFAFLASSPSFAVGAERRSEYYFHPTERLEPDEVDQLRKKLKCAAKECREIGEPCTQASKALSLLFEETFRQALPDVVVYIEREEGGSLKTYRPILLWKGKNTPYLFGARHLYVLLISDERLSLSARLTTIVEKGTNPLSGVLALLEFTPPGDSAAPEPETEAKEVSWQAVGKWPQDPYMGWARLDIALDSVNRLTISERGETVSREVTQPCPGCPPSETKITRKAVGPEPLPGDAEEVPFREITAHVSNSRPSYAGIGAAFGATFDVEDTALGDNGDIHPNAYALAKFYPFPSARPRLKVGPNHRKLFRRSLALVVGTNVTDDPLEEILLGVSVGHLMGKVGFTAAVNLVKPPAPMEDDATEEGSGSRNRESKFFFGIDYTF